MLDSVIDNDTIWCQMTQGANCRNAGGIIFNSPKKIMKVYSSVTPSLTITADKNNVCQQKIVHYIPNPINGGPSPKYYWYVNGVLVDTISNTLHKYMNPGVNKVHCMMKKNHPCSNAVWSYSDTVYTTVKPLITPGVVITLITSNLSPGGTCTFGVASVPSGPGILYNWYVNGVKVDTSSSNLFSRNNLKVGDSVYCTILLDSFCTINSISFSNYIVLKSTSDISEANSSFEWSVAPNPFFDRILIAIKDFVNLNGQISIIDLNGKIIQSIDVKDNKSFYSIDISTCSNGVYLIQFKNEHRNVMKRIVKN